MACWQICQIALKNCHGGFCGLLFGLGGGASEVMFVPGLWRLDEAARGADRAGICPGFMLVVPLCKRDCLAVLTRQWRWRTRYRAFSPCARTTPASLRVEARCARPLPCCAPQHHQGARPNAGSVLFAPRWWHATSGPHATCLVLNAVEAWSHSHCAKNLCTPRAGRTRAEVASGWAPWWCRAAERQGGRTQCASCSDSLALFERKG